MTSIKWKYQNKQDGLIGFKLLWAYLVFSQILFVMCTQASVYIPASHRMDVVHDESRNLAYISTRDGDILRYDVSSSNFLSPISIGGILGGIDLSPNMNTLIVADSSSSETHNWFHVVDLTSGNSRKIEFAKAFGESGTFTATFTDNDTVLVSSKFSGSGWVPLRKVDINTGISNTLASVRQDTMLTCSADHSTVAYAESNISSGKFGFYDVSMNSFTKSSTGWFTFEIGVSRNGTQFSVPTYGGMFVYNENLTKIGTIGNYASDLPIGVVYSPIADVMYLAWHDSDAIQAFNTNTLEYIESIDTETSFDWIGNHAFQEGRLRISDNGLLLFATVDGGVRMYEVPEPATICLLGLGSLILLRRRKK